MSSGGLVSALSGFKKSLNFTWIGWPGFFIPPKDRQLVDKRLMDEYSCQAVYLDDDVGDRHYNGFSNSILWPLFHYHPGEMNFEEENWQAYRQANMQFAEVVRQQITPGAMVWVQDYHLMLLPMLLRGIIDGPSKMGSFTKDELEKITEGLDFPAFSPTHVPIPGVKIGYFLHTPFPSSEIYRCVMSSIHTRFVINPLLGFSQCEEKSCWECCTAISLVSTRTTTPVTSFPHVHVSLASQRCRMVSNSRAG
jgi:trehalose 6-phosphate synthase